MAKPVRMGAVLYDPKVSIIWDIIREFFEAKDIGMDVSLYDTYEHQVDALVKGALDMAWNSPLAWLHTQHRAPDGFRAIAMRDTDRDRTTHFVVRSDSGIERIGDLRGRKIAMGAFDSPQARLIPMEVLRRAGLEAGRDYAAHRFDVLVGLHGDHIGGEKDAFQMLARGEADASCMLDLNWTTWTADGTINASEFKTVATTGLFDHCVFAVAKDFATARESHFLEALFSMSYDNPAHRQMMDMEGLKAWMPGRTTGFSLLSEAVQRTKFFEAAT
jgi:phosphonate transport system substrate-binding protein